MTPEQERAKLIGEIKHRFNHELSELRICLREPANIEWALDRIKQIEEYLEQLK